MPIEAKIKTLYDNTTGEAIAPKTTVEAVAGLKEYVDNAIIKSFDWGDQTVVGDSQWWSELKAWLKLSTLEEREHKIGMKKKIRLNGSLMGWNDKAEISMICIGADIDADCSLTFQTEGVSPGYETFGSTPLYAESTARTRAETFAKNSSAIDSIIKVTKLTSSYRNSNQDNPADVETEGEGFLLSGCEMGNSTHTPSQKEYTKGREEKAYPYYTNNDRRKKYMCLTNGEIGNTLQSYYLRTRDYTGENNICYIYSDGNESAGLVSNEHRLAPAFVIG